MFEATNPLLSISGSDASLGHPLLVAFSPALSASRPGAVRLTGMSIIVDSAWVHATILAPVRMIGRYAKTMSRSR